MKKLFKNKRLILILVIIILIIVLVVIGLVLGRKKETELINNYKFNNSREELPNTKEYTNDKLKEAHCIDGICIENVTFYYDGDNGRVEYNIYNKNSKEDSGYLKMIFKDKELIVVYNNLDIGSIRNSKSSFSKMKISNKEDYTLKKLSKSEIKKIIKK